jgi:hypothetical protein
MENDIERLLKTAMANVDLNKQNQGKKISQPDRNMLLEGHNQQRRQYMSQQNQFGLKQSMLCNVYPPCTTPLSSLQRIDIKDLLSETVHRGRYLLCRTIADAYKSTGVLSIIEDPTGTATPLSVYSCDYGIYPEELLPNGMYFAIREPYFKITARGGCSVRVDHPTDLIRLSSDDPIVSSTKWRTGAPRAKQTLSEEAWRTKGNEFFKRGRLLLAIERIQKGSNNIRITVLRCTIIALRHI